MMDSLKAVAISFAVVFSPKEVMVFDMRGGRIGGGLILLEVSEVSIVLIPLDADQTSPHRGD